MHLLLVEDDLDLGAEVQRSLAGRGFTSAWVRRAKEAKAFGDAANSAGFSCALLDLGLPDGEGLDVLRGWRDQGFAVPVIVLTARDAVASRVIGLDDGADDYLIKPVAPEELVSRIRAVTRRAAGHTSALWSVGRLQIDLRAREVWADGFAVALSPKEFSIVAELARRAGEVVPKHRIASALAPLDQPLEFNALEVHIHNLRRKLGAEAIRTVRGVGYCLAT